LFDGLIAAELHLNVLRQAFQRIRDLMDFNASFFLKEALFLKRLLQLVNVGLGQLFIVRNHLLQVKFEKRLYHLLIILELD
jgi:hypothetical protein